MENYMLLCSQNKKNQLIIIMKVLKHLGLVVMLITAVVLVLSYFNGWSNNNTITMSSLGTMVLGLILYVIGGKKSLENN